MTKRLLNAQDVLRQLRREVKQAGSQLEWARRRGVSRTHLNKTLRRSELLGPQIIKALGLKKIIVCAGSDRDDLITFLRQAVTEAGSISAWSRKTGIDRAVISLVMNGKRAPSPQFFRALKQKKVIAYVSQTLKSLPRARLSRNPSRTEI
jgi:DNA-binding phage protein